MFQGGEVGLTGKLKRKAILEKHGACIASMFVHKDQHRKNSMCEMESAACNDVKNHVPAPCLALVSNCLNWSNLVSAIQMHLGIPDHRGG